MGESQIPAAFADTFERIVKPLALNIANARTGTHTLGICGSQGSGKSTFAQAFTTFLTGLGIRCANLSLDDLYLTHAARVALGREVHPLLKTRGVPGTHDVELGLHTLNALKTATTTVALPRFDKSQDDRFPITRWPRVEAPVDVIVFEGWCVGARPQPDWMLEEPVNALEREEDPDGRWRAYVNRALAGEYQTMFAGIDTLIFLQAPSFDVVHRWRCEQENALRRALASAGPAAAPLHTMSDAELLRFISHYERLTRWVLSEMPQRADLTIELDTDRDVQMLRGRRAPNLLIP